MYVTYLHTTLVPHLPPLYKSMLRVSLTPTFLLTKSELQMCEVCTLSTGLSEVVPEIPVLVKQHPLRLDKSFPFLWQTVILTVFF